MWMASAGQTRSQVLHPTQTLSHFFMAGTTFSWFEHLTHMKSSAGISVMMVCGHECTQTPQRSLGADLLAGAAAQARELALAHAQRVLARYGVSVVREGVRVYVIAECAVALAVDNSHESSGHALLL